MENMHTDVGELTVKVTGVKEMITNSEKLLIVKQILLVGASRNVCRSVWRICMLMLRIKKIVVCGNPS